MASSDFTACANSLSTGNLARGATSGTSKPNGGGTFCWAGNSLTNVPGTVALYANQSNFAPMAKGCDVEAAMVRATSGGLTGWSCWIFCALGGTDVANNCYMLGLSDADPSRIVLRKGAMNLGIPDAAPGASGVLKRSTESVDVATWAHLRMEQVVQPNGDVWINLYKSDLVANAVGSPVWEPIPGMEWPDPPVDADPALAWIDDLAGINSGTLPYTSGRAGFGMRVSDVSRRAHLDQFRLARQLA